MKKVILKTIIDSDGITGIIVEGMKRLQYPSAAQEGFLIAHDLLEHVNGIKAIGSVDDELEAMGGCWFVRGKYGQMRKDNSGSMYSPEESIATDVINLGRIFIGGVDFRNPITKTNAGNDDEAFQEIMRFTKESLRDELNDDYDQKRYDFYLDNAIHFIRTGFRKAKRKHKESWRVNSLFWDIAETIDSYVKYAEYEGQQFILRYDKNTVQCEEHYEYDNY